MGEYESDFDGEDEDGVENEVKSFYLAKDREFAWLVDAVVTAARTVEPDRRFWAAKRGLEVVEQVMEATNERSWELHHLDGDGTKSARHRTLWRHIERPVLAGKKRLEPYIIVNDVQNAAANYLSLEYRVDALDRMLVEMLVAAEMFAFADEVQPVLKRKLPLLLRWIVGNIVSLTVSAIIAGFLLWLAPTSTFMQWTAGIIFGVAVLGALWSLVAFPFYYPELRRQNRKVQDVTNAMFDTYVALGGRPASVKHIGERMAKGTDLGVVWPAQLIVLMEDIQARRSSI